MLKELNMNNLLEKAGVDHYKDMAANGIISHKSSDNKTTYKERIERYAAWGGSIFEAILYGPSKPSPRDVALAWVIDDGFKERTHRKNIFNSMHSQVAIVAGPHPKTEFCYIGVFAQQILSKEEGKLIED